MGCAHCFLCHPRWMIFALRIVLVAGWAVSGPGLVRVFVRIASLRGVISAIAVWGLGYWLGGSRSLLFLGSTFVLGGGSVVSEYLCITYQQVYITEQLEGSVIKCYYYRMSYYDVCMRCLGDVSRGVCEVTRGFLFELS